MTTAVRETRVEYFKRLGATDEFGKKLADEFDSVEAFLVASFEEKLRAVVGKPQAATIAGEYDGFEDLRDRSDSRQLRSLDGVGGQSAHAVDHAYIRRTIFTPRDVISSRALAVKMGLVRDIEPPSPPQAQLGRWSG